MSFAGIAGAMKADAALHPADVGYSGAERIGGYENLFEKGRFLNQTGLSYDDTPPPYPICIKLRLPAGVWGPPAPKEYLCRARFCQQSWQNLARQSEFLGLPP